MAEFSTSAGVRAPSPPDQPPRRAGRGAQPYLVAVIFLTVLVGAVVWQAKATRTAKPHAVATPRWAAASPTVALAGADWAAAPYPMDCGTVGVRVLAVRLAKLTGDGRDEAVVHARCDAGAGSPPSGLYVFTAGAAGAKPRLLATLLDPAADELVSQVAAGPAGVTASGYRYSSDQIPRCCPDETFSHTWRWDGHAFVRS